MANNLEKQENDKNNTPNTTEDGICLSHHTVCPCFDRERFGYCTHLNSDSRTCGLVKKDC